VLTRIGAPPAAGGAVDLLLECHARIRSHLALARRLSAAQGAPAAEVREAAEGVRRYFAEALPLHARDEEESILPRLLGRERAVDAALEAMRREHGEHAPLLAALVGACATLARDPGRLPELAAPLAAVAADLERDLETHLREEEAVVLPAMRRLLDAGADREIVRELRARRGAAGASP
jgi:iron-sulfur cluster repair protein YtfE (RIC family)